MKKILAKTKILSLLMIFLAGILMAGCEKYLDQAPEASVNESDAFKDFNSFQGFTEELYNAQVDFESYINFGDDVKSNMSFVIGEELERGNYWAYLNARYQHFYNSGGPNLITTSPNNKGLWNNSWYGIHRANLGLENLNKMVNATQEEKDLIKGQLMFFRGYFYYEIMRNWGGMPYLKRTLSSTEEMKFPRLNYQETAKLAAADLDSAALLLPAKWDATVAGAKTSGDNRQRISKATAYAFEGKTLLFAASPLMNRESKGVAEFNVELCKNAAEAFSKAIALCESGSAPYSMQPWASYTDQFVLVTAAKTIPGGTEVMMFPPVWTPAQARQTPSTAWNLPQLVKAYDNSFAATNNYIKNYGMANGLPITDPDSKFNSADPWAGRDPRFYKTIMLDGEKAANLSSAGQDQFAQTANGGRHRYAATTGFFIKKYITPASNLFETWNDSYQFIIPMMRLSDVYLMYAEAVLQGYGTAQSSFTGSITAEAAFNKVRVRATNTPIGAAYTSDKQKFMNEIIRERAVELAFEGHRWYDLRRWMLIDKAEYKDRTELLFDRGAAATTPAGTSYFKPINMSERVMTTRVFLERHYWLPIPVSQASLYKEFPQNPGW